MRSDADRVCLSEKYVNSQWLNHILVKKITVECLLCLWQKKKKKKVTTNFEALLQ